MPDSYVFYFICYSFFHTSVKTFFSEHQHVIQVGLYYILLTNYKLKKLIYLRIYT